MNRKKIGNYGELLAKNYLQKHRYKIIEQNWRCKIGEIDLIAKKGKSLIIVEVKATVIKKNFYPEDHITPKKLHRLKKLSEIYCIYKKPSVSSIQIDVIAIEFSKTYKPNYIKHYQNIV